jgi:hypothetical protein
MNFYFIALLTYFYQFMILSSLYSILFVVASQSGCSTTVNHASHLRTEYVLQESWEKVSNAARVPAGPLRCVGPKGRSVDTRRLTLAHVCSLQRCSLENLESILVRTVPSRWRIIAIVG